MLRIISKEEEKIIFSKQEIEFSVFLSHLFLNNNDENNNENNDENKENIIEFKIPKVTICSLKKIKNIMQYIINNKLEINEELYDNYNLNKFIEISPTFTIKNFFELLDSVNYLHIEFIIKLMCKSIKDEISYMHISDIEKKYNLNKNDFSDKTKLTLNLFEKIVYKDN